MSGFPPKLPQDVQGITQCTQKSANVAQTRDPPTYLLLGVVYIIPIRDTSTLEWTFCPIIDQADIFPDFFPDPERAIAPLTPLPSPGTK